MLNVRARGRGELKRSDHTCKRSVMRTGTCRLKQSMSGRAGVQGEVLSGPAPRPLDTLPVKIEGGRLLVTYKEFKAGTAAKIEL